MRATSGATYQHGAPFRQHPPIKVNKRLTIHPANGKVRKQKRARASSSASDVPASLPLIIKQTFSRLHVRDFARGPFRAPCHDESSKILFRTRSAQDYDCFRVPSPRFQNLTRRRNCENVPIFRSRCLCYCTYIVISRNVERCRQSTSEDFHIRFVYMTEKHAKTSAIYLVVNFGPLSRRDIR